MEILKDIGMQLLPIVITAILPYLGVVLAKLLKKGFDYLESKTNSQYILQVIELAETSVLSSYQTILKDAKEKLKDGKIDAGEYASLKLKAKQEAAKVLKDFIGGLPKVAQEFLKDKVDSFVEGAIPKVKAKQRGLPINPTEPGQDGK